MSGGAEGHNEIIIVRRGGGDDDEGHHGGAWKIAFADFMTAMMCFFLVMWLINAANEQTKESIASYFNPVKLIDRNTNRKGIDDIGKGPQASNSEVLSETNTDNPVGERRTLSGPADNANSRDLADSVKRSDEHMFADPYAVLAEIAADTADKQNISVIGDGGASEAGPANGASGGESYRDPFAPDFWSTQVEAPAANETTERSLPEGEVAEQTPERPVRDGAQAPVNAQQPADPDAVNPFDGPPPSGVAERTPESEPTPVGTLVAEAAQAEEKPARAETAPPQDAAQAPPPEPAVPPGPSEATRRLAEQVRRELAEAFGGAQNLVGITVAESESSVTISVADDIRDGMFEIGSAVPRRQLVLAMEKIGKTLSQHTGSVTINGHTDGRPYKGGYDNWRLSTARAHATYYMLVRGGLAEGRIKSVAGYADRRLKLPDEPYASVNRRIEILLGAS